MILFLVAFGIGVLVGASAVWVWQAWTRANAPLPTGDMPQPHTVRLGHPPPHTHEYDHMVADGKGWRCRVCEKPKGGG